jgi:hypothetical protein
MRATLTVIVIVSGGRICPWVKKLTVAVCTHDDKSRTTNLVS